jgi:DNA ligase-1
VLFADLVEVSRLVAESSGRKRKIELLAGLLKKTPPPDLETAAAFLSGAVRQSRLGLGWSTLRAARDTTSAPEPVLAIGEIDATLTRIAEMSGAGSAAGRVALLRELLGRATAPEQDFIVRLLAGELRQGALESVLTDAVAAAAGIPAVRVRRAVMMAGALPPVARAALVDGAGALDAFVVRLMQPVQPMLADSEDDVGAALAETGSAAIEYKLDGARIQVHKDREQVRVFSRALNDVTAAVPEVVEAARQLPVDTVILDGEAIALRPDLTPHPFQQTMRRFGRRLDVEALRATLPLTPFFFDCLLAGGTPLVDDPLAQRIRILDDLVPETHRVPRLLAASAESAAGFAARALASGHEGVMVKALDAGYAAGRRGKAWLKVKTARSLDLVVLAAEWGSGRRRGFLSNLHLGARDAERGGFVMLGKTFKGLTDELLVWQTERFLSLELARDDYTVYLRPELVVEIAFNDIQVSPHYPGRLALRFARVKRYRDDKRPEDADSFDAVQELYRRLTGLEPPIR